jgi:hypothetical protein
MIRAWKQGWRLFCSRVDLFSLAVFGFATFMGVATLHPQALHCVTSSSETHRLSSAMLRLGGARPSIARAVIFFFLSGRSSDLRQQQRREGLALAGRRRWGRTAHQPACSRSSKDGRCSLAVGPQASATTPVAPSRRLRVGRKVAEARVR